MTTTSSDIRLGGKTCALPEIAPVEGARGGFAFGLYKAGSTLLNETLRRLARHSPTPYFNFVEHLRASDIVLERDEITPDARAAAEAYLAQPGVLFSGWRQYPLNYALPLTPQTPTYLLVRDPRDMITSHYFSLKYSHTTAGPAGRRIVEARARMEDMDIDRFAVRNAPRVREWFDAYEALGATALMLRRYEDVVFDKPGFVAGLCEHFELGVPRGAMARVAGMVDKRPAEEDIHAHVRQVTPGDHVNKLRPETIAEINQVLRPILVRYDYAEDVRGAA